jgi:hypothetical protein
MSTYSAKRSAVSRTVHPPCVLERLGKIPVVERQGGFNVPITESVRPGVDRSRGRLDSPAPARWLNAGPGDREAVGADAELGQEVEVFVHAVVVVTGDVAGVAIPDGARGVD